MVLINSSVVATKEQAHSDMDGEAVILNLQSGIYYGLNPIGASIWNQIQEPKTVKEIRDGILAKYKIEPSQCESDLLALLGKLETEGLIEVRDGATA